MKIIKIKKMLVINDREQCSHRISEKCFHPDKKNKVCFCDTYKIGFPARCPLETAKEPKNETH
jgi:hypothetical protein